MITKENLSTEYVAYSILLLPSPKREFVLQVIDAMTRPDTPHELDFMPGDIVDWKYSTPMNMLLLIEQTAILQHQGYQLQTIETVSQPCQCCTQKTSISLFYEKPGEINSEQVYELCLSCYTGFKLTAIRSGAEGEV